MTFLLSGMAWDMIAEREYDEFSLRSIRHSIHSYYFKKS